MNRITVTHERVRNRTTRLGRMHAVLMAAAVVAWGASCSHGSSGTGEADARTTTTTTQATTATTQPSATVDKAAAFADVKQLVLTATGLADKMYQDPAAAVNDPAHQNFARYESLFVKEAGTPADVEAAIRKLAADGQHLRASPRSGVYRETSVYSFRAADPDTVRFRVCSLRDIEIVSSSGAVVSRRAEVEQGDGEALRRSGIWRFSGVHPDETGPLPLKPGQVKSGFCDRLAANVGGQAP